MLGLLCLVPQKKRNLWFKVPRRIDPHTHTIILHVYIYIFTHQCVLNQVYVFNSWRLGRVNSEPILKNRWWGKAVRALLPVVRGVGHFKWRCRREKKIGNSGVGWGKLEPVGCILMWNDHIYPLPAGTFESRIFRSSWGGICYCNSLVG